MDILKLRELQRKHIELYLSWEVSIIPVKLRDKKPTLPNWQNSNLSLEEIEKLFFNGTPNNLGIVLNSGFIDIDLDSPKACQIADQFLPKTAVFGRKNNPHSHFIYRSENAITKKYEYNGETLIEQRASGQTVFPPGIHSSEDVIEWETSPDPQFIEAKEIRKLTGKIAAVTALSYHWKDGTRQHISMCLAKIFLDQGWNNEEISIFFTAVCAVTEDPELDRRLTAVDATKKRQEKDGKTCGIPRLEELTCKELVDKFKDWLQIEQKNYEFAVFDIHKKKDDKTTPGIKVVSARDIILKKFDPVKYIIPGIITEGLTVLAGRPKTCKSFLSLNFSLSVTTGIPALKQIETNRTGVLHAALEDGERRLNWRMKNILGENWYNLLPHNLNFCFTLPKLGSGCIETLNNYITENPGTGLIIIDTYKFVKPNIMKGNAYELDYEYASSLQKWALSNHKAVILVHHTRKNTTSNDWQDEISGSNGLMGAADCNILLDKKRHDSDAILKITGRDLPENELAIFFNKDTTSWELLGDAELHKISKERKEILKALEENKTSMTPKEISEILNKPYNNIKKLIWKMELDGILVKVSRGKYFIGNCGNYDNCGNSGNLVTFNKVTESYQSNTDTVTLQTEVAQGKEHESYQVTGVTNKVTEKVTGNFSSGNFEENDITDVPF